MNEDRKHSILDGVLTLVLAGLVMATVYYMLLAFNI